MHECGPHETNMTQRLFRRTALRAGALVFAVLMIAGCSSTPMCLEPQPYTKAEAYPDLTIPPGLEPVASNDAMTIPEVPDGPIKVYDAPPANTESQDPAAVCLTTPPPLPKSVIDVSKTTGSS